MIQLLFTVLGLEVVLLFKTPLRKIAILGLDRLKRGRGPVMVKTVAATLMMVLGSSGYSMFKIHDRSNELGQLTPTDQKSIEVTTKLNRALEEAKNGGNSETQEKEIDGLKEEIKKLKSQLNAKEEEVKSAKAGSLALRKQSEGLLLEYDRLLEDNQHLRSQLQSIDLRLSHSDSNKKDT